MDFKGLLLIFCLAISLSAFAQSDAPTFDINSKTIFKDKNGERISFETFLDWTSGSDYEMTPVFNDDNTLKEIIVLRSDIAGPITSASDFGTTEELIGRRPPEFELTDLNGNFWSLGNLKNKVVVLKFWFRACPPCIKEIPDLNRLVNDYGSEVVFLGAALDSKEECEKFLRARSFNYNVIPDALSFARSYNVPGYPTHVVIGRDGKVEVVYKGVNHNIYDKLKSAIDRSLIREINTEVVQRSEEKQEENELFVTPQSIIKNEEGMVIPFGDFVTLMNTARFELLPRTNEAGDKYLLMKEVVVD